MESYRIFRKDKQRRRGEAITLYVNHQMQCMEIYLEMDEEPVKSS